LHWLAIAQRIEYKIAQLRPRYTSPVYFHGICLPVASVDGDAMLMSANYR